MSHQDDLVEVRIELEDLKRRQWALERRVMELIAADTPSYDTHEYAPAPHVAPFCQSDDEPPSKPA